ncbi:uncharacterized protein METZ01_LOCUS416100, partial [marine metagenome]
MCAKTAKAAARQYRKQSDGSIGGQQVPKGE